MLTAANGDRPGVDNVVIVLTDGLSTQGMARTAAAAKALKHKANRCVKK